MIDIKLHEGQIEVYQDDHRFKIICAGRRWGKSVLSRIIVYDWSTKDPGLYWIVSPTYKQAKMIHWREVLKEVPKEWVEKKNEVELSLTLKNGSIIELKGADNPDSLRGVKLKGLVVDEIASIKDWDWLWQEVLRATLTDHQSPAIFISTPKGFNHFYELYNQGQSPGDYKSWKFTTYDNPFIAYEEVETAKKELTDETFAQEYMADFRQYVGLVYKEFDPDIHIVEPFDIPTDFQVYGGMDFGSTNPTVHLWGVLDKDDNLFIVDEHYEAGKTIEYHAGIIKSNQLHSKLQNTFADPSGAQWIKEFQERGLYITKANKELATANDQWVRLGIEKVRERLKPQAGHFVDALWEQNKDSMPRLYIFDNCKNLIDEFKNYSWREKKQDYLNEPDIPEKAHDHALDALRYLVVSYKHQPVIDVPDQWHKDQWRIGK